MGLANVVEHRGMELHELHVGHGALGAVDHGYAVAGGYDGVRRGLIHCAHAAGTHHGHSREVGVHLLGLGVEHVGSVALYVGCAARHFNTQMVLRDDFYGKVVLPDVDVGAGSHCLHESALNLGTGVVGMVQYAELGVSALAVQVELAVAVAVEVHSPAHELAYLLGSHLHHLLHCCRV